MKELEYPFDCDFIIKKKKNIRQQLLENEQKFLKKNIAILHGSETAEISSVLELFLLNYGIKPKFYELNLKDVSPGKNKELTDFNPDIIFIHTTNKNITFYPTLRDTEKDVNQKLTDEFEKFINLWNSLEKNHKSIIIQNNFDYPFYRLLGNKDATDIHGKVNFITRLNLKFAEYAESHSNFLINDINYQSASFGIDKWTDELYWYMEGYALAKEAIPTLAFNIANIIKAVYKKKKKAFALDLDYTLWGGIVGDDGAENLEVGDKTAEGKIYASFQGYLKEYKDMGVVLTVNSKNNDNQAIAGLENPNNVLKKEDFVVIKTNWNSKSQNMLEIAKELNLGVDSIVFVDDTPAEREIINQQLKGVATPNIGYDPQYYIKNIDKSGFFEAISLFDEDLNKTEVYKQNKARNDLMLTIDDYNDYLRSLNMIATIDKFKPSYMSRITQLTNKSNQFNLTTKRYTQAEIEECAESKKYVTLYGKLTDKFGDNGIISAVIGHIDKKKMDIDLWIMSCRVLKRNMEFAMMDSLVEEAKNNDVEKIYGHYYPTEKNTMVKDFYYMQGFTKINEDSEGNTTWELDVKNYDKKNRFIRLEAS